ncbi:MAG TPA: single-stranded-DNA-specific exonuclease RecJ [Phycisphaerae bacterium]|nr:single-stranded-DNA-specific exonuclease RecJ [Phycisphaerae bacterium]
MPKDWVIAPPAQGRDALATALRISPIAAQILCIRGVSEVAAARQFLKPAIADLPPPETFPATLRAADRIVEAIRSGWKIVLYGDYDVDGVTGVAILWHCLRLAGADPAFYIPDRMEEGYGLSPSALDKLANEGAQLIVSIDCGVTAIEPAALARQRGVELIITDHHQPKIGADGRPQLPDALLVHPDLAQDGDPPYSNPHLSGAGVALKLAWAIAQRYCGSTKVPPEFRDFLVDAIGLAALGTVADIVPLIGENRIIAHHGLLGLPQSRILGVQALLKTSGLLGKKLGGFDIGFKLAPRLNAIGRMGHARLAVELLTRAGADEAATIARNLDEQNRKRQSVEREIVAQAKQMVLDQRQNDDAVRAIVLAAPGWHAGIIGIVASRIVETYGRPAVLIAVENGVGQGSARSIRNFPLTAALNECRDHLLTCGGHAMAAGLRIDASCIDAFREAFQARAAQLLTPADLRPQLRLDDLVSLDHLDESLVADLDRLEPCGAGNPPARLATDWLEVVGEPRVVGSSGTHLQVTLAQGRRQCKGIAFGQAPLRGNLLDHRRCRAAFRPIVNEWNNRRSVEMEIVDFQFPP